MSYISSMKNLLTIILSLLPSIVLTQNTNLERLFIERVNTVRDSVGVSPLFLIEEYREISNNHVSYILRTGHVSHDQIGTTTPNSVKRAEKYSDGELGSYSEILTYNTSTLNNDTLIVNKFIKSFLSSEQHKNLLLSDTQGSCTVAIYHSTNKNICVVNFTRSTYYNGKYAKYDWSYFSD